MKNLYLTQSLQDYKEEIWNYREKYILLGQKIEGAPQLENVNEISEWFDYLEQFVSPDTKNFVPSREYLLIEECDQERKLIGILNLRLLLNDYFAEYGGHVGISIVPEMQGQGYGTRAIKLILEEARRFLMEKILITCEEKNVASARILEKNGGKFEELRFVKSKNVKLKRYWFDLSQMEGNKDDGKVDIG